MGTEAQAGVAGSDNRANLSGQHRFLLIKMPSPIKADSVVVRSLAGREAISRLFLFEVDLASENLEITSDQVVGRPVTVTVVIDDRHDRFISGYVSRFAVLPSKDVYAHYRLRVVPWLWFLTRTTDCAIYQNKTVPEIIEAVFKKYNLHDFRVNLQRKYTQREYCVQYRETACAFVMRLLEEEGICFYFDHEEDKHTLVLTDYPGDHQPCPAQPDVEGKSDKPTPGARDEGRIQDWVRRVEVRPKKWTQGDFQFKTPRLKLLSTSPTKSELPFPDFEHYDYPGRFANSSEGSELTDLRMEEDEAGIDLIEGKSRCRALIPGYTIHVHNQFRPDQEGNFLLTSVEHRAEQGLPFITDTRVKQSYRNTFTCIPAQTPFRPRRMTPVPVIAGPQTAFVTGPSGEEIYTDSFGRVRVQFHWDRQGKYDDNSSCWVRVAQSMAGKGWGSVFLPRVGQEVIVEFLEGDPDRPLITGCVYNADYTQPYKLPDNRSMSLFKSFSYPGGGGFNELRFEDKKGQEQVFIHGEKDLHMRVKNDRREWIGQDRHLIVKRDKLEEVDRDKHEVIQRDCIESIQRDHHVTIQGKEAVQITGSLSLSVQGNVVEQFQGSHSEQVTQSYYVKGMNVVVEAMTGLTIKVGGNFITINSAGIQIFGTMVMINSGGAPLAGMPGNLVSPMSPSQAAEADKADPGAKGDPLQADGASSSADGSSSSSSAKDAPWHDPNSSENKDKKSWIEIELVDEANKPVPGEAYRVTLPDGTTIASGTLDDKGRARVDNIDPGTCKVTFPRLDKNSWKPK